MAFWCISHVGHYTNLILLSMLTRSFLSTLVICLSVLLCGCGTLNKWALKAGYKQVVVAQTELVQLKDAQAKEIESLNVDLRSKMQKALDAYDAQKQVAGNALYGAQMTFETIGQPSRTDVIINNFVNEGWTAIDSKMPDQATMIKINQRVRDELDETKTSMEELRKTHDATMVENKKLSDDAKAKKEAINAVEKLLSDTKLAHASALNDKQKEINDKLTKINALESERADNKEWIQAQKAKGIAVCGVLALLCVAGAVWMPFGRMSFIIGATVFGLSAAAIGFIEPWMVAAGCGVIILGVVGYLVYEHNATNEALVSVTGAVQEMKVTATDAYNTTLKPLLLDWNTKYVTSNTPTGPQTIKVPDVAVQATIEKTLTDGNLK